MSYLTIPTLISLLLNHVHSHVHSHAYADGLGHVWRMWSDQETSKDKWTFCSVSESFQPNSVLVHTMDAELGVGLLVVAVGCYILCSLYLLRNPLILHKKKRLAFYSRHISHRGGECSGYSDLSLLFCTLWS